MTRRVLVATSLIAGCGFEPGGAAPAIDADPNAPDADPDQPDADPDRPDAGTPDADGGPPMLFWDFEGGLQGPFSGIYTMPNNDAVNHNTSMAVSGTRSAHCETDNANNGQAALYLDFSMRDTIYVGMWVRLDSGFPAPSFVMLSSIVNDAAAWTNIATMDLHTDMRVGVLNGASGTITKSTATLAIDTWYFLELRVRAHPSGGRLGLWIDGVEQFDMHGIDTGALQFHRVLTGIAWLDVGNDVVEIFVDDVTID